MMPVPWKLWEGQVVDFCFPLRRYLGGTDRSAVFLTEYSDPEPRDAVIKLVPAEAGDSELASQWERASQLSHVHLLRLWQTGKCQVNHQPMRYAVMEYADEDLASVLAERALTAAEVRGILGPLFEALGYIHREGLVHGHIKPANILAVEDQLKLSVDGISLVGEPGAAQCLPGPYDPPEFGERGYSPLGDVWSFGMTLVEALTQQLPALGGAKQEPVLPESLLAEFLPMARACLRPDPRRRATLDDIRTRFQTADANPPGEPVEEPIRGRKRWLSLALVSASAVAIAALLAAPRLLHRTAPSAPARQGAVEATVQAAPKVADVPPAAAPTLRAAEGGAEAAGGTEKVRVVRAVRGAAPKPDPRALQGATEAAPGQVVHRVLPDVTAEARRTIRGRVQVAVRASVDPAGHVTAARVESQNSRYFANLALQAARQWSFEPGPGEWLLRFEFTPAGTTVHPSPVAR
jgi:TonB family protein